MTLQSTPPISLSNIAAEFGASAPYSLTDFYRGGSFVPDIAENAGVPTSGTISISDFYGTSAIDQRLNTTVTAGSAGPLIGYVSESFGSITNANYFDGNVVSRNVGRITWDSSNILIFGLSGTSIPNDDTTFAQLIVNATTFRRSDASYAPSASSRTEWTWSGVPDPWGTNPNNFDIFVVVP